MTKPNWITVNPSSGTGAGIFKITFAQNTSTSSRSGIVTVKSLSGLTHEIQVTQAGKATKGKITFKYTGEKIPQTFVGYRLYIGLNNDAFTEFYADYGSIEAITNNTLVVNFDNMTPENLDITLSTIKSDMTETDDIYFGVSISDDPNTEWIPLLYVTETGSETFTSDNMAVIIQDAFNGISAVIDAENLIVPSQPTCTWGLSAANLLLASITSKILDSVSTSEVTFSVYADLYPDGERLNNNISMNNIRVGSFTLGVGSGQSLSQPVVLKTSKDSQFKWAKEWSTVALCRFTIKSKNYAISSVLNKTLIINGKTFTKHETGAETYFENTEGIPLRYTTDRQTLNISSNYPTLAFQHLY